MGLRPNDPDTQEYTKAMYAAYGEERAESYLGRSIHHVLVYPYLSVQSPLQQLRVLRPVAPNKTLSEIWHFRLKGVSPAIYRRSLWYFNLVNSPATMIKCGRSGELDQGTVGPRVQRRRLGKLSPQFRRRHTRRQHNVFQQRDFGGRHAKSVRGVVPIYVGASPGAGMNRGGADQATAG